MNDRDQRRLDRLTRVQTFGQQHAADFPAGSRARAHFNRIDAVLRLLAGAKAGQAPARTSKETLLDALQLDFKAIARTARAIETAEPPAPGFAAPYRVPDPATEFAVRTHADALLARLEDDTENDSAEKKTAKAALRARFTGYSLPADFVADLRADYDAIVSTHTSNEVKSQAGVENTARIGELLRSANADLEQLDVIVTNTFERVPETLHVWKRASRVERGPHRGKDANGNGSTPPPAPPPAH